MFITIDWLHVISLLGAVQGLFLAGVLVTKRTNRTANRLLAAVTVAFSVYLTSAVYRAVGWMPVFPHFLGVSNPLPLVFGPLIYLYAVHASDRTRRLGKRDLLHFVPATAVVIATLPMYLQSGPEKIAFYQQLQGGDIPRLLQVIDWLKFVSGVSYTVATIRHLLRHRLTVMNSYSTVERVNLRWLLWLTSASAVVWALATALHVFLVLNLPPRHGENLVALGIAIMVYGIGYRGLRQPEVFNFVTSEFPVAAAAPAPPAPPVPPADQSPRYQHSGLGDQEAESLKDALLLAMEKERPYRDSDLTLADLAERLNTTPHKLSEVLSQRVGLTFYDFVNRYRVEEVQRRVADTRSQNLTLLALALDAGFASKSTFNNVFKRHTGKTPSDYRRALAS